MTVWCHLPTILKRYHALRIVGLVPLIVAIITTVFLSSTTHAAPGINQTLSFQGRLLSNTGAVVPDGYYNMQFKIYQDGDGTKAGDTGGSGGTLKWTESYVNNNGTSGVQVKDGFFSVALGSQNPFGSQVDWNQDTLWLSMNVAGSSSACTDFGASPCTADGEMLPMKRITSVPFALNSGMLGGKTASQFIQLAQGVQTDASSNTSSIFINKTGTGNLLQLQSNATDSFTIGNTGDLTFGNNANKSISISTAAANTAGNSLTIVAGGGGSGTGSTGGDLVLQGGSAGGTNGNGGNVSIDSGAAAGTGTGGTISIGATDAGSISLGNATTGTTQIALNGTTTIKTQQDSTSAFNVTTSLNNKVLTVDTLNGRVGIGGMSTSAPTLSGYGLEVQGALRLSGGGDGLMDDIFTTPTGSKVHTKINIPLYDPGQYGQLIALGLPQTADPTARVMSLFDARTTAHQPTLGVFSPNEDNLVGFSWDGSNTVATIKNTANSIALQGGGTNILTANNNGGNATVGIGNAGNSGYALDVTGDINASSEYRVGGDASLTNSALTFGGGTSSAIAAATNQSLSLSADNGVNIQVGGTTSATFNSTNIQIGSGSGVGDPVLLTLDKSASAPSGAALGSMYYDTSLGKVQCYQNNGWGACGNSPDSFVTLSPEYSNAVMNGAGTGTITSDFCSDSLNINDGSSGQPTVCGSNETYNFYGWNSTQTSAQTRSIYVTYQLPSTFKNFVAGSTSLMGRTDDSDATVAYQIYKSHGGSALSACSNALTVSTGAQTSWQKNTATNTDDPSNCGFTAGDSILIRIDLTSSNNKNAYVSNLNFAFSNQ